MKRTRWIRLTILGLIVGVAAGAAAAELWPNAMERCPGEPLYFNVTVSRHGQPIAHPQLVGESGKDLRLVLSEPTGEPRMELRLHPSLVRPLDGSHLAVDLHLDVPGEPGLKSSLKAAHGQEVEAALSDDVDVSLMVMRVRSPEFEAWVRDAPVRLENLVEPE